MKPKPPSKTKTLPIMELRHKIDECLGCGELTEVDEVLKAISRHPEGKSLASGPVLMLQQYASTLRAQKLSDSVRAPAQGFSSLTQGFLSH